MNRFEAYPKTRISLPKVFQDIYTEHYKNNREGNTTASGLAQKMEAWLHRQVAADVQTREHLATLEIGAGTLNQLAYEPHARPYDIIEPFEYLFQDATALKEVRTVYKDIREVPSEKKYDRITSVATLEHITDLPKVVAMSCLLMKAGASFRAAIPNEGTFLWTLGWRMTTGIEFWLKHRLDYGILMRYEHVNNASEIEEVLEYFFESINCKVFGLSKGIALYRFYDCRQPKIGRAKQYLESQK